jgi:hypothetical protein
MTGLLSIHVLALRCQLSFIPITTVMATLTLFVPPFQIDLSVRQCISRSFEPVLFKHARHKEKTVLEQGYSVSSR